MLVGLRNKPRVIVFVSQKKLLSTALFNKKKKTYT